MGIHSGKFGVVDGQSTVRNWNIVDTMNNPKFVASNTKFGTGRRRGVHDWTGNFQQYGATPTIMPGDVFAFLGYTAPTGDVANGAGERGTGNAIVDSVNINWNWKGGEILNSALNFSGHLALAWAQGADIDDASDPNAPEVAGTKIEYAIGLGAFAELTDLISASLTISAANQSYVNSSSHIAGKTWTGRRSGPIDWTLAIVHESEIRGAFPFNKGDDISLRLYIDDTDFWLLKWGKVKDFTNLTADIETGAILNRTINIEMNGFVDGDEGEITLPGETAPWWPATLI